MGVLPVSVAVMVAVAVVFVLGRLFHTAVSVVLDYSRGALIVM